MKAKIDADCEDRTHDLGIMRPTLYQLSQAGFLYDKNVFFVVGLEKKEPHVGIEPPAFRLQSECSTTKLSRPH